MQDMANIQRQHVFRSALGASPDLVSLFCTVNYMLVWLGKIAAIYGASLLACWKASLTLISICTWSLTQRKKNIICTKRLLYQPIHGEACGNFFVKKESDSGDLDGTAITEGGYHL